MRAFAVLMMVQGHTIHTLLSNDLRTDESLLYNIWYLMRGFTAPVFMFTSGVVFTYLFIIKNKSFDENPRVKKGLIRFATLLSIGYLLRYPTPSLFDFSRVTQEQWTIFFTVDALHLIACGIFFIIVASFIAEKLKIRYEFMYAVTVVIIFLASPLVLSTNWRTILPLPLASYLSNNTGSYFPLFPWLGYMFAGAVLGNYLAKKNEIIKSVRFSFRLFAVGILLLGCSVLLRQFEEFLNYSTGVELNVSITFIFRLGVVIMLNGIISFISVKIENIPLIIKHVGKNTLPIYIVHLIILYGCAWAPGIYSFAAGSMGWEESLGGAILLISLMIGMVMIFERYKTVWRKKLAMVKI